MLTARIDLLLMALKGALTSAATDDMRPHLYGVLVVADEDRLAVVGTDGHRLTRVRIAVEGLEAWGDREALITKCEAERLVCNLETQDPRSHVTLSYTDDGVTVGRYGTFLCATEESFPPYRKVLRAQALPEPDLLLREELDGLSLKKQRGDLRVSVDLLQRVRRRLEDAESALPKSVRIDPRYWQSACDVFCAVMPTATMVMAPTIDPALPLRCDGQSPDLGVDLTVVIMPRRL